MFDVIRAVTWAQVVSTLITIGWWLLATGLVNLIARRSQVDAWCERNPKLGAALKVSRSFGWDPWLLVQAFTLFVKGKLPASLRDSLPILLAAAALLSFGCASSFEEARLVSPQAGATADRARCEELDDRRVWWGGGAKVAAVLAGSSGLAAIPVESQKAQVGLAAGALAAGALAAGAVYVSEAAGERWVEECR